MQRPLEARIARGTSRRRPAHARLLARVLTTSMLASVAGSIALAGCGRPFAEGGSGEITVISEWPPDAPELLLLRAILEREAVRIESEPAYSIRFVAPGDARAYRARNVLVVGAGSSVPKPARRLAGLLRNGDPFVFTTDVWLRGQSAGLIWVDSRPDWIPAVAASQNRLFHALDRSTFATVRARVSSLPHDDRLERRLADEVGVKLRVPRGYRLTVKTRDGAALLLEEGPPARLFRVASLRDSSADLADLRSARARLARLFRPHERTLALAEPVLTPNELKGSTRQVNGRWEDEQVTAAGPFRAYEVHRGTRRYLVDLAVFAPGRPKLPYLRELMAIAETLEPVAASR